MRNLSAAAVLLSLSAVATNAEANGLIQKLPPDGSWVRYHMTMKNEMPDKKEWSVTVTVRSVGTITQNGEKCRWIEFEMEPPEGEKGTKFVLKGLIPEKDLRTDQKPETGIVRGWKRHGQREIQELENSEKSPNGMLATFLPGSRDGAKNLDEGKTVDYQKGRLECVSGITGTISLTGLNPKTPESVTTVTSSIWPHENVPFGVAAARFQFRKERKGVVVDAATATYVLEDFGTGAKSALPEKK